MTKKNKYLVLFRLLNVDNGLRRSVIHKRQKPHEQVTVTDGYGGGLTTRAAKHISLECTNEMLTKKDHGVSPEANHERIWEIPR